jgi:endonuclease/exonuclease/phosphatase family metal-dependent hydrolase
VLSGHPSTALRSRERGNPRTEQNEETGQTGQAPEPAPPGHGPRRRRVAVWLTLVALLLALWSATTFIDSGNFVITSLSSLSLVVTVLALPVIAIGVGSRHIVPTVIALAAALLPWGFVAGYAAAGPGVATVGTGSTLRVMSVDGAQGKANAMNIVQVAQAYSVDVVVVTQLSNELAHQLTVDGLNVLGTAQWVQVPADGMNGTGVWSTAQIQNPQAINQLSRPGVSGEIQTGSGPLGITVVQLTGDPLTRSSSWHSDMTKLAKLTEPTKPGFLVGDLNATPWQPAFRKLTGTGLRDAADVVGQGLRPTWPSWSPLPVVPLDHVMVTPGVGVSSASNPTIAGSNHRALIVTLVLPQSAGD